MGIMGFMGVMGKLIIYHLSFSFAPFIIYHLSFSEASFLKLHILTFVISDDLLVGFFGRPLV